MERKAGVCEWGRTTKNVCAGGNKMTAGEVGRCLCAWVRG